LNLKGALIVPGTIRLSPFDAVGLQLNPSILPQFESCGFIDQLQLTPKSLGECDQAAEKITICGHITSLA
jgi:hypothetical protein